MQHKAMPYNLVLITKMFDLNQFSVIANYSLAELKVFCCLNSVWLMAHGSGKVMFATYIHVEFKSRIPERQKKTFLNQIWLKLASKPTCMWKIVKNLPAHTLELGDVPWDAMQLRTKNEQQISCFSELHSKQSLILYSPNQSNSLYFHVNSNWPKYKIKVW